MPFSIAIDGPAGAGKSTMAKAVAKKRGALYLDTGAMYRALAVHMLNRRVPLESDEAILAELPNAHVDVRFAKGVQRVYVNGEDVTDCIREERVSAAASRVSAIAKVREEMVRMQREIAKGEDIVMDGRDIGTCVLPDASVKIFLTATPEARAKRRHAEFLEKGVPCDYETVLADLIKRDENDIRRAASPLRKAGDAVELDTTNMDIPQSVEAIERIIRRREIRNIDSERD